MDEFRGQCTRTFISQNVAWVVGVMDETSHQQFITEQTSDGGSHWQSSQLSGPFDYTAETPDSPHFLNMQEGWLDFPGYDNDISDDQLFHTTDGGLHWSKLAITKQIRQNVGQFADTGISVKDAQNIWETVETQMDYQARQMPNVPMAFVSHDGGKIWQQQTLPPIPGWANARYVTLPPVFFGNDGLMPVKVIDVTSGDVGLSFYVTNDGGIHWSSRAGIRWSGLAETAGYADPVYILDRQHIWAASSNGSGRMYESQDGAKSWNTLRSIGKPSTLVASMSFPDTNNGWVIPLILVADPNANLLHTSDGGRTWQPIAYSIQ